MTTEQQDLVNELRETVSIYLAAFAEKAFNEGRTIEEVKEMFRRAIGVADAERKQEIAQ